MNETSSQKVIDDLRRQQEKLLDCLEQMVRQHCMNPGDDGLVDANGLWANANALELLESYSRFRIDAGYGKTVRGYFPEEDITHDDYRPCHDANP